MIVISSILFACATLGILASNLPVPLGELFQKKSNSEKTGKILSCNLTFFVCSFLFLIFLVFAFPDISPMPTVISRFIIAVLICSIVSVPSFLIGIVLSFRTIIKIMPGVRIPLVAAVFALSTTWALSGISKLENPIVLFMGCICLYSLILYLAASYRWTFTVLLTCIGAASIYGQLEVSGIVLFYWVCWTGLHLIGKWKQDELSAVVFLPAVCFAFIGVYMRVYSLL